MLVFQDHIAHNGPHAIIDAEASLICGVRGEEHGIVWKVCDALRKLGAKEGWFEAVRVSDVVCKELGKGLVVQLGGCRSRKVPFC